MTSVPGPHDWEVIVLELTRRELSAHADQFATLELDMPQPEVVKAEGEHMHIELVAPIISHGDIVDMIEFSVIREGRPVASEAETVSWLRQTLRDVFARQCRKSESHKS